MKQGLLKGPWSKQEDEILKEYINIYGPKNWNAVQRLTGLARDGKSCRLRWLNQLDPSLKKGKLSEEEKQKILQLRQLKKKWCEIVKEIPGRTDNEIKNFFNINERKKRKMENDNGECRKKKKSYLPLKDEIVKPHDNELNANGESSMSVFNNQQDISNTDEMGRIKDICNINHPSNSFHIPIIQPSNMVCNNVASTSISNISSPTFNDRGEAPFMPIGMVANLSPLLESTNFQDTSISKDEIVKPHDNNELNTIGESNMSGFNNQQQDISNTREMELIKDICNINHPSNSFHIPITQPLNMVCNNVASTSISNISSPTFIERDEAPFMPIGMVSNLPPLLESTDFQDTSISNNSSPTFIDRGKAPFMPFGMVSDLSPLLEIEFPFHPDTSINNNSSPTFLDRGEAPIMPFGMVSNLPPLLEIESPLHPNTFISNNSSPTFIDRGEAPFMPFGMVSDLPPLLEIESPLHPDTSINNNSSPTFLDRGKAPFMPFGMVSNLPPLLEIESPLHPDTFISNNFSPTFIDRGEPSFVPMNMEPSLSPLTESINFQSFESSLMHKYPPLPLRSAEEIQQEQFEPDFPSNNGLLESMVNTSKILEGSNYREDLIDLVDCLGLLDNYIF